MFKLSFTFKYLSDINGSNGEDDPLNISATFKNSDEELQNSLNLIYKNFSARVILNINFW